MSIFGKIISSIFGKASAAGATPAAPAPGAKPSSAAPASAPAGSIPEVDVAGILTNLASEKKEKLEWQKSIVDLMKLLDLDSSLSARKELAQELQYTGDIEQLGFDECVAAQAGHAEARQKRRQRARGTEGLKRPIGATKGRSDSRIDRADSRSCRLNASAWRLQRFGPNSGTLQFPATVNIPTLS